MGLLVGFLFPMMALASTGVIDPVLHYSRLCASVDCTSYSRINWLPTHTTVPVVVSDTGVVGIIWSENMGWVNLAPTTAMSIDPAHAGIHNTTAGVLTGDAWGEAGSWINFSPLHGGVTINPTTGEFLGDAWVSNFGWIKFDCSLTDGAGNHDACVKTDWRGTASLCLDTTATNFGGPLPCTYPTPPPLLCTDPTATNVGGVLPCLYTATCTDTTATNYGAAGSCVYGGTCTDHSALNYGAAGSCIYSIVTGPTCTDHAALNYGADGACHYPAAVLCLDHSAINYGAVGSCHYSLPTTCIDHSALNYGLVGDCTYKKITITIPPIKKINPTIGTTVSTVGAVGSTAIAVATTIFLNSMSLSDILLIPIRLWSLLMGALGLAKRKKPWGTVYDSVTKQPLDPAYVILRNSEGKDVATAITDLDGRYGFIVNEPGNYVIIANKTNYLFPSQKLVGSDHDELYEELYFGEHFNISRAGEVITKNIPMDPIKFDWNEFAKRSQHLMKFYSRKEKWLRYISNIFMFVGFTFATYSVLTVTNKLNIAIFAVYMLLLVVRKYGLAARPFGNIISKETKQPLPYAIIRISQAGTGVEIMHRPADILGRFYCLLPNGEYLIRIDRKTDDGKYETVADKLPATVKKGYLSNKFVV